MKKSSVLALFMMIFVLMFALPVNAATSSNAKLVDEAELLSSEEFSEISAQLEAASESTDMDIVVITAPSFDGDSVQDCADLRYDNDGYAEDGILFYIAMEDRDYAFTTKGFGITAYTDAGLEYIEDHIMESLSAGNYTEAFTKYAEVCEQLGEQARNGEPYDVEQPKKKKPIFLYLILSIVLGCIYSAMSNGSKKAAHTSVHKESKAANYVTERNLTTQRDIFLYKHVTRTKKEKSESKGGSTTHKSSNGQTHGGKSGKF